MTRNEVIQIVEALAAAGLLRINRITNNYYSCYCPIHKDGQERKPSFGILLEDEVRNGQKYYAGFAHCFSCGYAKQLSELISDILKLKSVSTSVTDWLLEHVPGVSITHQSDDHLIDPAQMSIFMQNQAVSYVQSMQTSKRPYVTEEELAKYRYTVPYMYERHLTDEIIAKYDVGYQADWIPPGKSKPVPCITFPVRDKSGNTLFICRRSISGKLYNYPTGVTKPIYGIDMIPKDCKSLIICESVINCLTLATWGYDAIALLGTGNTFQVEQLRRLNMPEFVICTDGDDAGRRAASKLKRNLSDIAIVWTINMPDGKDVNDCTYQEFVNLYDMRE